jgi:hypothetical protein
VGILARVEQLHGHAHPVSLLDHGPFENALHAELRRDLRQRPACALELHDGGPGDHPPGANLRELADQRIGESVGEVLPLGITGEVLQREDRERSDRLLLPGCSRPRCHCARGSSLSAHPEDGHRLRHALELLLPERPRLDSRLIANRAVDLARGVDAPGLGERADPRGDVHAVSVELPALEQRLTQVDADAELQLGIFPHRLLNRERTIDGVDRAREHGEELVPVSSIRSPWYCSTRVRTTERLRWRTRRPCSSSRAIRAV